MAKMIKFPKQQKDPAVEKIKGMIKWSTFHDEHPILVGEFQIVGKSDFPAGPKIGKKKLEHEKTKMAEDLLMALREMIK